MKWPHLLRAGGWNDAFGELIRAGREAGLRIGWLELASVESSPDRGVEAVADPAVVAGAMRAVRVTPLAAGGARVETRKLLAGAPVLRDLVREHFLGCALVLVAGAGAEAHPNIAGRLQPAPGGTAADGPAWRLNLEAEREEKTVALSTADLLARLRRPRLD